MRGLEIGFACADEARQYGLVSRVVEAGRALQGARDLAGEVLDGSPTSVRASLQIMAETQGIADTVDAVRFRSPAHDEVTASEVAIEGRARVRREATPAVAQPVSARPCMAARSRELRDPDGGHPPCPRGPR